MPRSNKFWLCLALAALLSGCAGLKRIEGERETVNEGGEKTTPQKPGEKPGTKKPDAPKRITGRKLQQKTYYWHTGYPGGIKERTADKILGGKFPERILEKAVERMLPKESPLARKQLTHLRIYNSGEHPHEAHYLKLDISKVRSRLDWHPALRLNGALKLIIDWSKQRQAGADMRELTLEQIHAYQALTAH